MPRERGSNQQEESEMSASAEKSLKELLDQLSAEVTAINNLQEEARRNKLEALRIKRLDEDNEKLSREALTILNKKVTPLLRQRARLISRIRSRLPTDVLAAIDPLVREEILYGLGFLAQRANEALRDDSLLESELLPMKGSKVGDPNRLEELIKRFRKS